MATARHSHDSHLEGTKNVSAVLTPYFERTKLDIDCYCYIVSVSPKSLALCLVFTVSNLNFQLQTFSWLPHDKRYRQHDLAVKRDLALVSIGRQYTCNITVLVIMSLAKFKYCMAIIQSCRSTQSTLVELAMNPLHYHTRQRQRLIKHNYQ